jgi:hypothetical protein
MLQCRVRKDQILPKSKGLLSRVELSMRENDHEKELPKRKLFLSKAADARLEQS